MKQLKRTALLALIVFTLTLPVTAWAAAPEIRQCSKGDTVRAFQAAVHITAKWRNRNENV